MARYPALQLLVGVLFVLLFFFLIKKFFKMALVTVLIILLGLMGYFFLTSKGSVDQKMKSAFEKTKSKTTGVIESGKDLVKEGADKVTKDTGKLVDKQTRGLYKQKKDLEIRIRI